MPALLSISVGVVFADFLLAWIFHHIHRREPTPHLRLWALAWLVDAIASMAGSAQIMLRGGVLLEGVAALAVLAQSLLLMRGTTEFARHRMGRGWWILAPVSIVCAGVMLWLGLPWPLPTLAPMAFLAAATAWTGITVLRTADASGAVAWLPGVALVLLGVHYFDFPLVGGSVLLAPWGMMLTLVLRVAIGAGFLMLHFERAHDGLKASEGRYRSLFEDAIEGVFRTRVDGTILDANPAFARILGYQSPAELVGTSAVEFYVDPADRTRLAASAAGGGGTLEPTEVAWRRSDGRHITVQLYGRGVADDLGQTLHYQAFVRDMTEARALERQLFQAQRMETVGRLAGGIAHDFNNLLTVISASADIIASEGGRSAELAVGISEATQRAAALTQQLLTFAGRERRKPQVVAVTPIVKGLLEMLERSLGKNISLEVEAPEEELHALADPAQIEQIVMNLVLNARDAIPGEGRVDIRVARAPASAVHDGQHGFVTLEVSDSGGGIDEETLPHIFEPFYTTKGPGRGTGLGLATVYAIATQSGGKVEVESAKGKGTTFRIYLPEAEPLAEPAREMEREGSKPVHARMRGTVLLVEDEPAVRNVARRILEAARYSVITAANGADAIACARRDIPLDVLLTDVVMRGLDGPHTASEIRRLRPGIGVVFMSGYPERLERNTWVDNLGARFLAKPFAAADLVAAVDMCGAPQEHQLAPEPATRGAATHSV